MEAALVGRAEGERFGFELEPVDAYGDRNPELIQRVTRKMLAEHAGADATFEPGDLVEFAAPNGGRYSGVLKEINDESALFDFNHPRGRAPARGRGAVGSAVMSEPVTAASAEVVLAQPRGFCAGVDRAIDIVERALELHGAPIYVRHEIVHNRYVVEDLRAKGAVFIDELEDAPRAPSWCSRPTACHRPCAPKPTPVACRCSTPPARW